MSTMLRQMPLAVFLFFTALPLAAAGIALFAGLRARRQAAVMKATPASNIGMASDGYGKFEGNSEAIGGEPLQAPLTRSPCIWYHAKVEKWTPERGGEQSSGHWATVQELTSSAPFFLRDSTGACTVAPWLAEVTPSDKSQWYGDNPTPTNHNPPRLSPTESSQPVLEIRSGKGAFRYYEERIYADTPLLVMGHFSQGRFDAGNDDDEDSVSDEGSTGAAVEDDEGTEATGASTSDDEIADRLRALARQTTSASVSRGTGPKPFIITTQLQAVHLAMSEMGSQAAMALAAGCGGLAALMLWARFG
jgi:E3 Ubiquitin ligase